MNLEVWSTPAVIIKFGVFASNRSRMVFFPPPGPIRVKNLGKIIEKRTEYTIFIENELPVSKWFYCPSYEIYIKDL